jgi:hypothetical protein
VELDRVEADAEAEGDLFVGEALGHLLEDLSFSGRENVRLSKGSAGGEERRAQQCEGGGAVEGDQAGRGGVERGNDLFAIGLLR